MIQITSEALERQVAEAEQARQTKDLPRAEALFLQVLRVNAGHAGALAGLGHVYRDAGQAAAAADAYRRAIASGSPAVMLWREIGRVLMQAARAQEAVEAFRHAVGLRPDDADAWNELGGALGGTGRIEEAADAYRRAFALVPQHAPALNNYGGTLRAQGRLSEAVAAFDRALAVDPRYVEIQNNRAEALMMMGRQEEAIATYRALLDVRPNSTYAWDGYLYALHLVEHGDPSFVYQEHRRWERAVALPVAANPPPHAHDRSPERRLRVGYVSSDLREHSVAAFMEGLLAHHDRGAVEVFCYSGVTREDAVTARLKANTDVWRPVAGHSHEALARQIGQDGIDILVDLHGHTTGSRLLTFAQKPVPVQVAYLGYPATTGLSAMDYRLTDAYADPVEGAAGGPLPEELHSEKLVRLPNTFLCWRPPDECPPTVSDKMVKRRFTFASFNTLPKVSAQSIAMWAEILRRFPDSALLLKAVGLAEEGTRRGIIEKFATHGIHEKRLALVDRLPSVTRHLEYYQVVDVALDTYPYCGTTTSMEALWMGVPVVTLAGKVHASRVGASILTSAGLADLVASTPDEYVSKAVAIAEDFLRRRDLRRVLREQMRASPLLDAARFARHVEGAYREMWRAWCAEKGGGGG